MSNQEKTTLPAAHAGPGESQEQRWVKYGANVALNIVLVIAIGCIAVYAAQRFNRRSDVTSNAIFGLKPQTVKIIEKLDKPVEIVALYYKLQTDDANERQDFRTPVLDLLEEYKRTSKNITVEAIDPVNEPTMYDGWLKKLKDKYGGNYKEYDNVLKDAPKALAGVKKLASAEMERMQKLQEEQMKKYQEEQAKKHK